MMSTYHYIMLCYTHIRQKYYTYTCYASQWIHSILRQCILSKIIINKQNSGLLKESKTPCIKRHLNMLKTFNSKVWFLSNWIRVTIFGHWCVPDTQWRWQHKTPSSANQRPVPGSRDLPRPIRRRQETGAPVTREKECLETGDSLLSHPTLSLFFPKTQQTQRKRQSSNTDQGLGIDKSHCPHYQIKESISFEHPFSCSKHRKQPKHLHYNTHIYLDKSRKGF